MDNVSEQINEVNKYIEDVEDEVKEATFLTIDLLNFEDFNREVEIPYSGNYTFEVEQQFLEEAIKIVGVSSQSNVNSGLIEITLFEDKVKLAAFNQISFAEMFIPKVNSSSEEGCIKFYFEKEFLDKIASRLYGSNIIFQLEAEKKLLTVISGETKLKFDIPSEPRIVNYHLKLKNIVNIDSFDVNLLKDSIKYISYFVRKNDIRKNLSQADCNSRMLYGGSSLSVGIYKSHHFNKLKFDIKYECLNLLFRVLPYFNKHNVGFFESENYYIIRDEKLFFGFEKTRYDFPSITKFLEADIVDDIITLDRKRLIEGINKLSIVLSGKDSLIKFKLTEDNTFHMFVLDKKHKVSTDSFQVERKSVKNSEVKLNTGLEFIIDLDSFMKTVSHFNTKEITLQYVLNKALVVRDTSSDYEVISNFSLFSKESMNKL